MSMSYKLIGQNIALNGFFSEYLPPCFSLDPKVLRRPPSAECDLIPPYSFTMSRFSGNDARRTLFLPEIGSYLAAHIFMDENNIYQELIEYTKTSKHSFSPILDDADNIMYHEQVYSQLDEGENIPSSQYISNVGEKLIRAAGAKKILKLDISNCYASFYMHMIPAIVLGIEAAEENYNLHLKKANDSDISPKYITYMHFDQAIRRQNLNRTNGLLPGIMSSKIIIESILTRIDFELEANGIQFVRYVDDYEVFIYNHEEQTVITIFSNILKKYGFALNSEKTDIIDFPFYISENFERLLERASEDELTRADLLQIFNTFFELETKGTKGSIRYLLKHFEKNPPAINDPELFKAYLLTIIANNERSLSKACTLLLSDKVPPLNQNDQKTIKDMLDAHRLHGHDLETLWLLYLLIETKCVTPNDSLVESIVKTDNELAHALLLRRNLISDDMLRQVKENASSWILLYELYATDNLEESSFVDKLNLSKNLKMYQNFKTTRIHFVS